jgi:hypothetical protein
MRSCLRKSDLNLAPIAHPSTENAGDRAAVKIAPARLPAIERFAIALLLVAIVAFGTLTLMRSAYLTHRHTDADVYFRAAWAAHTGGDIYDATDTNGWHYHYPPLLATLMIPLADPPEDVPLPARGGTLPYPLSVAIWYALSVLALAAGIHFLARTIEGSLLPDPPPGHLFGALWWRLRMWPVFLLLEPIGHALGRGQANPLVFLCLAAAAAELIRRKSTVAGLWLGCAAAIKVFPVFLVLVPLWRRDWKCMGGWIVGLLLGVLVVPGLVVGFPKATAYVTEFGQVLVRQLINGEPSVRSGELFNAATGDLMSFKSILFKVTHFWPASRPAEVPRTFDILHVALSGWLTLVSLAAYSWWPRRPIAGEDALIPVLLVGVLVTVSVPMVPSAQSHYFSLSLVLTIGLVAAYLLGGAKARWNKPLLVAALTFAVVMSSIREFPGLGIMTDVGAPVLGGLVFWAMGLRELRRRTALQSVQSGKEATPAAA